MSKRPENLTRKWEVLAMLDKGLTPLAVATSLSLPTYLVQSDISWLMGNGHCQRVKIGQYRRTGKPELWKPSGGKAEILGKVGGMFVIAREHPLSYGIMDYVGVRLGGGSLEVETVGLGGLLKGLVRFPVPIPLLAISRKCIMEALNEKM
jgi:hypothetical protein